MRHPQCCSCEMQGREVFPAIAFISGLATVGLLLAIKSVWVTTGQTALAGLEGDTMWFKNISVSWELNNVSPLLRNRISSPSWPLTPIVCHFLEKTTALRWVRSWWRTRFYKYLTSFYDILNKNIGPRETFQSIFIPFCFIWFVLEPQATLKRRRYLNASCIFKYGI